MLLISHCLTLPLTLKTKSKHSTMTMHYLFEYVHPEMSLYALDGYEN